VAQGLKYLTATSGIFKKPRSTETVPLPINQFKMATSTQDEGNLAAVLDAPGARLKIVNRPIPTPGPNEIVVRNYAVAANPVDCK